MVFCLMMIPALDHGCRPPGAVWNLPLPVPTMNWPVSDVSCTVIVPFPVTGWCAK